MRLLHLAPLCAALLLGGCDQLGIESASRRGGAQGSRRQGHRRRLPACDRSVEDCYANNKRAEKAAVFAGWKEMNDYMRENNIAAVPAGRDTAVAAWQGTEAEAPGASPVTKTGDKAADKGGDKAAAKTPAKPKPADKPAAKDAPKSPRLEAAQRPGRPAAFRRASAACRAALAVRPLAWAQFGSSTQPESPMLKMSFRTAFRPRGLAVSGLVAAGRPGRGHHGFGQVATETRTLPEFQAIELGGSMDLKCARVRRNPCRCRPTTTCCLCWKPWSKAPADAAGAR
jgi:hypothetical protein